MMPAFVRLSLWPVAAYLFLAAAGLVCSAQTPDADRTRAGYVLNVGDDVLIRARDSEELNEKSFRVDGDGWLNLPLIGRVRAAGVTVAGLEQELVKALAVYIRNPQASITITGLRPDPVFFVGAFQKPGVHALQGRRTLFDMLALTGGLQPNSVRRIKVTRRQEHGPIPSPRARKEADGSTMLEVSIGESAAISAADDLLLLPYDVISAEKAEMVYVTGEIGKAGGFEVADRESVMAAKLIAMMGGLTRDADPSKARVLRPILNSNRRAEIPLDLNSILAGRTADFPLYPNDVLFVPKGKKTLVLKTASFVAAPLVSGLLFLVFR